MIDSKPLVIPAIGSLIGAALQLEMPTYLLLVFCVVGLVSVIYRHVVVGRVALFLFFVVLFNVWGKQHHWSQNRLHYEHLGSSETAEFGVSVTEVKGKFQNQVWGKIKELNGDMPVQGNVVLFKNKNCDCDIQMGHELVVRSRLINPRGKDSPRSFDYAKYLSSKGVFKIAYFDCDDVISVSESNGFYTLLNKIQGRSLDYFKDAFGQSSAYEELLGFMFGRTNFMEREQLTEYRQMGIGHLFAVSGMHVMMVFGVFKLILFLGGFNPSLRFLLQVFSVLGIWAFVAVCGFGPSAIRAALLLSFLVLGKMLGKKTDGWNLLAVTALISITHNPHVVFDVGFQFSYLALIAIFTFYKKIESWCQPKNSLLKSGWSFIALSICAQLGVLPLSLFYFGYFSPYFWLTGLLVFVQVAVSMYTAMVVLLLSFFGIDFGLGIWLIEMAVDSIDFIIEYIKLLPFSLVTWRPSLWLTLVLYGMFFWLMMALYQKQIKYSLACVFVCLCLYGFGSWKALENMEEIALVIPKQRSGEAIYLCRKNGFQLSDDIALFKNVVGVETTDDKTILHQSYTPQLNPNSAFYLVGQWPKKNYYSLIREIGREKILTNNKTYHKINLSK